MMSLPTPSFAALPAGNQPLSLLDQQFNAVAIAGTLSCTATGTNTLLLTSAPNVFAPTSYTNGAPRFVWVQPLTTIAGPVTINVNSIGAITAYKANGQVALGSGDLVAGCVYTATYSSALSSGGGGFAVDALPSAGPPGPTGPAGPTGPTGPTGPVGGASVTASDTPPASPVVGQLWFDTAGVLLYVWYNDGTSSQWVDANNMGGLGGIVTEAPLDGNIYGRQSGTWVNVAVANVLRSYLAGLTLSTAGSSTSFSVAAGTAADSTNARMMMLASPISKTTAAWAAGTGVGALDTGAIAASTWYHVHLIMRTDTGVVDVLVSLSASGPTLPASYTLFRRIGSMKTNASSQWIKFLQMGDTFEWDVPVADVTGGNVSNAAASIALPSVPPGVKITAIFGAYATSTLANNMLFAWDPDTTGSTSVGAPLFICPPGYGAGTVRVMTNALQQVRFITSGAPGVSSLTINTVGWVDRRGKDN